MINLTRQQCNNNNHNDKFNANDIMVTITESNDTGNVDLRNGKAFWAIISLKNSEIFLLFDIVGL